MYLKTPWLCGPVGTRALWYQVLCDPRGAGAGKVPECRAMAGCPLSFLILHLSWSWHCSSLGDLVILSQPSGYSPKVGVTHSSSEFTVVRVRVTEN